MAEGRELGMDARDSRSTWLAEQLLEDVGNGVPRVSRSDASRRRDETVPRTDEKRVRGADRHPSLAGVPSVQGRRRGSSVTKRRDTPCIAGDP
jgi:hypothetical protein